MLSSRIGKRTQDRGSLVKTLRIAIATVLFAFLVSPFGSAQTCGGDSGDSQGGQCYSYPDTTPTRYGGMNVCGDWGFGCTECIVDCENGETCITDGGWCGPGARVLHPVM
jgi:hypothetical protein